MPIQVILYKMEYVGILVDITKLRSLIKQIKYSENQLVKNIFSLHGSSFNIDSVSEVAKVLGIHMKQESSMPSTSKHVLRKIELPIAAKILQYRKLKATAANILKPILRKLEESRSIRLHCNSFSLTSTGRISMQEPCIQNVPKDFEVSCPDKKEEIIFSCRSIFIASDDKCFVSADYWQLELRVLTHLSQDKNLLKITKTKSDIFKLIASEWFKIDYINIEESQRNQAKQICYGIIYGMGIKTLAEALQINENEAIILFEKFHSSFPGIR